MRVFLFSIVAICIAGGSTQEIAIGTDYLRAQFNDSIASGRSITINAQDSNSPSNVVILAPAVNLDSSSSTTTTAASTTDDDNSQATDDNKKDTKYDHEHKSHHEHDATITVDLHNILDLLKQQLQEMEGRILAVVRPELTGNPVIVPKSYRTADR